MIYTCTTNPSLDYYLEFENGFKTNKLNRPSKEHFEAGGKGVNVSIVLSNLGIQSNCLGFLGGFTKDYYLSFLKQYKYIQPLFTSISENTRINLRIGSESITKINTIGPKITNEEFLKFKNRINSIYDDDVFILSGNIEKEIEESIIDSIKYLCENNVKVILNTDENILKETIKFNPFLAVVEKDETLSKEEIINILNDCLSNGAKYVLLTNGNKDIYISNGEKTYCFDMQDIDYNASAGYVDSLIAGYTFTLIRGGNFKECFDFGCACAKATAEKSLMFNREDVDSYLNDLNIFEI